jgi:CBS domain-containing protein
VRIPARLLGASDRPPDGVRATGAILARVDIASFLRLYPPFDDLDEERLEEVVRHTQIEFFPAGTVIQHQSGEPSGFLYMVRTGAVEAVDGDLVADVLGEGELFGFVSLFTGLGPAFTLRALEDTICYLIDQEVARELMATRRGLAFLAGSLRRREVSMLEGSERETADPWAAPASALMREPPLAVPIDSTIQQAAELMARERVSSVLVQGGDELGILTDRDLRAKVLAAGRSAQTPVAEILTAPIVSVRPEMPAAEVLRLMYERGIHHVPVVDDGAVIGMVTDTDLMGLEQRRPFVLKSELERAPTVDAAIEIGSRLPEMFVLLVEASVDALDIAHAVAVTIDALTTRLLELGMSEMEEPPCPWAWLSLGSEARHEQALLTDQDHAIAYEPGGRAIEMVDPYFANLAEFVTSGLEAAGIRRCRGGVMAVNRKWRRPLPEWVWQFNTWITTPGPLGSEVGSIAFDYRRVAGSLDVGASIDELIRRAAASPMFMQHLARRAIDPSPPTGFFRDLVIEARGEWAGTLDVKSGGIIPITNLARAYAVGAGLTENRTPRRLRAAATAGRVDEETCAGLTEAFSLLWQIRLEHQSGLVRAGRPPDDHVDPKALGPLTRQGAKVAFRLVDRAQRALATELGMRMR